jgi:hypothetical protein
LGHNRFDEESKRKWRKQEEKNVDMTCLRCRKTHVPRKYGRLLKWRKHEGMNVDQTCSRYVLFFMFS